MQVKIDSSLEKWLNDVYNDGTPKRTIRAELETKLNEGSDFKVSVGLTDVDRVWTMLGLDPENRPKVKKQLEFVLVSKQLSFEQLKADANTIPEALPHLVNSQEDNLTW